MNIVKEVYGALWCADTQRSRSFLDLRGIEYEWIDVDVDEPGEEFVFKVNTDNKRRIPVIVFSDNSCLIEPSDEELAKKIEAIIIALQSQ